MQIPGMGSVDVMCAISAVALPLSLQWAALQSLRSDCSIPSAQTHRSVSSPWFSILTTPHK